MARITISESELIDALRAATGNGESGPADAFTLKEIKAATGWGDRRVLAHLYLLKAQGMLQIVTVNRERLDGRVGGVPGYRFLKKPRKAGGV